MRNEGYLIRIIRDEFAALKESIIEYRIFLVLALLVLLGLMYLLSPLPDKKILIATSGERSAYTLIADDQRTSLAQHGIELEVLPTSDSLESARLLADKKSGVNVALIQGGLIDESLAKQLRSLGSVAYEPVWIFYKTNLRKQPTNIVDLASMRIGVGPKNGGTWSILSHLFLLNGVDIQRLPGVKADSYDNNLRDYVAGELDVLINVNPHIDPIVNQLLRDPNTSLLELQHAIAYDKNIPYLKAVTLPAYAIDIEHRIPPKDVTLLATTTSLVVRSDMHPSLQAVLLLATKNTQRVSENIFLSGAERFPSYMDPTIPISDAASHFYDYGAPQTLRYLPFSLAGFVDQVWLYIVTVIAILYPLSYLNANLRAKRYEQKLGHIRRRLVKIESQLDDVALSHDQRKTLQRQLSEIEADLRQRQVPIGCEIDYFDLLSVITTINAKAFS